MKQLIPEKLNSKLDMIVTKCFAGNRMADRGMTILGVKFAMNKSESILHAKIAHLFPALADVVSEYQSSRDNLTFYGATPADNTDYATPLEFFEKLVEFMIDLESLVVEVMEDAVTEDMSTYAFLLEYLRKLNPVTGQCLLLLDKAENYKDDWMAFDYRIDSFITL